ncbi:hypothetical protein H9M94_00475 [Mycoplasma sp. Pen4]|uniref:hypothetical protein n=1 Tax=Mycoplasma sp. Pen4 TaxID=640330 RepID=UPI001653F212|nr:hypothetical protein [Mycoplasma sp. Pen4]QNM93739.1 hypothetical protein H9M94_00475 [Mycoplasma sp. Pen4]
MGIKISISITIKSQPLGQFIKERLFNQNNKDFIKRNWIILFIFLLEIIGFVLFYNYYWPKVRDSSFPNASPGNSVPASLGYRDEPYSITGTETIILTADIIYTSIFVLFFNFLVLFILTYNFNYFAKKGVKYKSYRLPANTFLILWLVINVTFVIIYNNYFMERKMRAFTDVENSRILFHLSNSFFACLSILISFYISKKISQKTQKTWISYVIFGFYLMSSVIILLVLSIKAFNHFNSYDWEKFSRPGNNLTYQNMIKDEKLFASVTPFIVLLNPFSSVMFVQFYKFAFHFNAFYIASDILTNIWRDKSFDQTPIYYFKACFISYFTILLAMLSIASFDKDKILNMLHGMRKIYYKITTRFKRVSSN